MRRGAFLILFCLIAVEGLSAAVEAGAVRRHTAVALHDNVAVRARPSPGARVLATLVQQTQVEVLGTKHGWSHVTMWASVKGWVLSHDLGHRKQWNTTST